MSEATEDPHTVMHVYEGDGGVIIRENGNVSSFGVQSAEVQAAFAAATAAVPADIAALTPLEWSKSWGPDEDGDEHHTASTPFGSYTVERSRGRWKWKYCFDEYYDEDEASCRDLDEGKAAAQAHWNERVSDVVEHLRSALTAAYASLAAETERRIAAENDRDRFIEGKVLAEASLAEARKALEPFVVLAGSVFRVDEDGREMNEAKRDDQAVWGHDRVEITYGHLRAARRAHKGGADHA